MTLETHGLSDRCIIRHLKPPHQMWQGMYLLAPTSQLCLFLAQQWSNINLNNVLYGYLTGRTSAGSLERHPCPFWQVPLGWRADLHMAI